MRFLKDFSLKVLILFLFYAVLTGCAASSKDTLYEFKLAFHNKNWNKVWDMLATEDKKQFEENNYKSFMEEVEKTNGASLQGSDLTKEQAEKMSVKEYFIYGMSQNTECNTEKTFTFQTESVRKLKNQSIIKLRNDPRQYLLKKEMGIWKVSLNS